MPRDSKAPPHSLEAERAVLGGIMRGYLNGDGTPHEKARAILSASDFYFEHHRPIFKAMDEMASRGEPIDLITLPERLRAKGHLENVGGVTFLSKLLDATPTAGHIRHHAEIVREKANLRRVRSPVWCCT